MRHVQRIRPLHGHEVRPWHPEPVGHTGRVRLQFALRLCRQVIQVMVVNRARRTRRLITGLRGGEGQLVHGVALDSGEASPGQ